MQRKPLGEYELFKKWSGRPRTWGANSEARAWFGGQLLDGLCTVLDEHLAAAGGQSAAIGCVPWLTSYAVIDRLAKLTSLCVVIDKGTENRDAVSRLMGEHQDGFQRGFPNSAVSGLSDMMPAPNGERFIVCPYTPREAMEYLIEPVRIVGWRGGRNNPILHAKMLVLGRIDLEAYGHPDYGSDERLEFQPMAVWWGSANWTEGSRNHLEVGSVTNDAKFLSAATDFVADVIAFSEPLGSDCAGPEPNMLRCEVDDAAMWEASEQQRLS
ncbi:hypothetical protein LAUMK191_05669 [Mycobacterium attenuatum]|uniref:Phospholipase D-like domain-containing protein n=1 Tax=Mycobacterium attenuatum TaxID=2341086 RepID=A0A498Q358_9MYCO|nr:hypothetical protein [Mycobacterium attenuatum]VBA38775.1 hypothetical protein LAUMK136_02643 [Mycobacterium attenuatum]VBA60766.1 hypothetical protein LAUMK191_05669 [Mycobacterium attenuatum]